VIPAYHGSLSGTAWALLIGPIGGLLDIAFIDATAVRFGTIGNGLRDQLRRSAPPRSSSWSTYTIFVLIHKRPTGGHYCALTQCWCNLGGT